MDEEIPVRIPGLGTIPCTKRLYPGEPLKQEGGAGDVGDDAPKNTEDSQDE